MKAEEIDLSCSLRANWLAKRTKNAPHSAGRTMPLRDLGSHRASGGLRIFNALNIGKTERDLCIVEIERRRTQVPWVPLRLPFASGCPITARVDHDERASRT